jgi:hypothetical protein
MVPVSVAVVRYEQNEEAALVAVIVPERIALLAPVFGPCVRVPVTLTGGRPVSAVDESTPVKLPLRGVTGTADHVPVEVSKVVQAPAAVEN